MNHAIRLESMLPFCYLDPENIVDIQSSWSTKDRNCLNKICLGAMLADTYNGQHENETSSSVPTTT